MTSPAEQRRVTMTEMMGLRWCAGSSPSSEVGHMESVFPLAEVGRWGDLAFGGGMLAMAVNAASQTLDAKADTMALYSVVGHFLGGANRYTTLRLDVTRLRDTRTFATRHVMLWQQRDDGQRRNCCSLQLDFVDVTQDRTLLQYQADPRLNVTHHSQLLEWHEELAERVQDRTIGQRTLDEQRDMLGHLTRHCKSKYTPESMAWHSVDGVLPKASTPQDALPVTQRAALFEWFHVRFPLEIKRGTLDGQRVLMPPTQRIASAAFLAFHLDGYLAMAPVIVSHMSITSAGAALTLELALRFPLNDLDASQWYLRQVSTIASANERTLGETMCWQEDVDGKLQLAAHMTQATVLRKAKL